MFSSCLEYITTKLFIFDLFKLLQLRVTVKLFLIKTESKIIDFTVKNQLQKLAKHLDTVLEL